MDWWERAIYNRLGGKQSSGSVELSAPFKALYLSFCSLVFDVRSAKYMGAIAPSHKVEIFRFFRIERGN